LAVVIPTTIDINIIILEYLLLNGSFRYNLNFNIKYPIGINTNVGIIANLTASARVLAFKLMNNIIAIEQIINDTLKNLLKSSCILNLIIISKYVFSFIYIF